MESGRKADTDMSGTVSATPPAGFTDTYTSGLVPSAYTDANGQVHYGYALPTPASPGAGSAGSGSNPAAAGSTTSTGNILPGATGATTASLPTGWGNFLSELFKRIGVVIIGFLIIMVALFWLFGDAAIHELGSDK